jgi:endonuclease III-like uncharacterized protein
MNKLKEKFRKNELSYTLLKRNEVVAMFGVGGTYADEIFLYEVCRIYIRNDKYGIRESLPSKEQFSRDLSRSFVDKESALRYFDELTDKLKMAQGGHKAVSGVQRSAEVMREYHLA